MKRYISSIAIAAAAAGIGVSTLASGANGAASSTARRLPTLTLAINPKSVTVGGTLQSGAVKLRTTVSGEGHSEPTLFRMNRDVPFSAFATAVAAVGAHHGDLNYLDPYGSIVFDEGVGKGTSSAQIALHPGNYIALDLASPSPNPPHVTFTITQAAHPVTLPKPDATITSIEFAFHGPTRLHDGELVRFQNSGFLMHQIQGIEVKNAKAAEHLTALLLAGKDTQASKVGISFPEFAGPLSAGARQQERINQHPGVYVLVCIMRTQDGREHTLLGMERTIKIVK